MWDYILKSAEGKSKFVTMETLSSDVAKITPAFKIILYTLIVGFLSGYSRILVIGFHPILQGALLGLLLGTMCGKTLAIGEQVPSNHLITRLLALLIGISAWLIHFLALGKALPEENLSFFMLAWFSNDMREIPQIIPFLGIGPMLEGVSRNGWMVANILDALFFLVAVQFTMLQATKVRLPEKVSKANWQVYRMLFLVIALYGSAFAIERDQTSTNIKALNIWTDEVWSSHYLDLIHDQIDAIQLPETDDLRIELDEAIEKGKSMVREFPEGHYLTAIEQLEKGNYFFARDELGRAILEAEQMTRRTWLSDNTPIHRDLLLAQLYQLRAKLLLEKDNGLAAERDLTVSIYIHKDFWPDEPEQLNNGFFKHQPELLLEAGYDPQFGFGSCHYERSLARQDFAPEDAKKDLEEAISLGYQVSDR